MELIDLDLNKVSNFSDLDLNKVYTYEDYLKWTFDETVELIRGRIFKMAAPLVNHQESSGNIQNIFKNYLKGKPCKVYSAPFDVRLPKPVTLRKSDKDMQTVVQPDVCIICDLKKLDKRGCIGAPDLIVEVLSKGTANRDFKDKFEIYEESGVKEYWIVDYHLKTVMVYKLTESGKFIGSHHPYIIGETIEVGIFNDLSVAVADIFDGLIDFDDED